MKPSTGSDGESSGKEYVQDQETLQSPEITPDQETLQSPEITPDSELGDLEPIYINPDLVAAQLFNANQRKAVVAGMEGATSVGAEVACVSKIATPRKESCASIKQDGSFRIIAENVDAREQLYVWATRGQMESSKITVTVQVWGRIFPEEVTVMKKTADGLYVGSPNGVYYISKEDLNKDKHEIFPQHITIGHGLPSNYVSSMEVDGNDNLWIGVRQMSGGTGGLVRLTTHEGRNLEFDRLKALGAYPAALLYDEERNCLWVGTHYGKILKVSIQDPITVVEEYELSVDRTKYGKLTSLEIEKNGTILVGLKKVVGLKGKNGALLRFQPEEETFQLIPYPALTMAGVEVLVRDDARRKGVPSSAIWIGQYSQISYYRNNSLITCSLVDNKDSSMRLKGNYVRTILPDGSGGAYIGSESGLYHVESVGEKDETCAFETYVQSRSFGSGTYNDSTGDRIEERNTWDGASKRLSETIDSVTSLLKVGDWLMMGSNRFGSTYGLYRLSAANLSQVRLGGINVQLMNSRRGLPSNFVFDLSVDENTGNVWIAHKRGLSRMYDGGERKEFENLPFGQRGLTKAFVSVDDVGNAWLFGSYGSEKIFSYVRLQDNGKSSANEYVLPVRSAAVNEISADREGVWITTFREVLHFSREKAEVDLRCDQPELSSDYEKSIVVDGENGAWIGTYDGLFYVSRSPRGCEVKRILSGIGISSITQDGQENLWLGTRGGALLYINKDSRKEAKAEEIFSRTPGGQIRDIVTNARGDVFLATFKGLVQLTFDVDPFSVSYFGEKTGLPSLSVSSLAAGPNGEVYGGTSNGLFLVP